MKFSKIIVNNHNFLKCINICDIVFVEAEGPYSEINIEKSKKVVVCKSLKKIEEKLCDFGFIRINRSFLVNVDHIIEIKKPKFEILLSNGIKIKVSKRYKSKLLQALQIELLKL